MPAGGTPALDLIARAGVPHAVHEYEPPDRHGRDRDRRPNYGTDAAAALGVDPRLVHKTLAASVDGRLVLAVVPVDRELDLKRLADAVGGRRAVMADPAEAERATGYVVGGISPLGSRRALPVVLDAAALDLDSLLCRPAGAASRSNWRPRIWCVLPTQMSPGSSETPRSPDTIAFGWHTGTAPRQAP